MQKSTTFTPRGRVILAQVAFAILAITALVWPFFNPPFSNFRMSTVFVYLIVAMGLNLLTGYTGQISLGHSAFFALGAYLAAIIAATTGVHYLLALPVAVVAGYVTGYLFGMPAARLEGLYLAMITLALALVTPVIIRQLGSYTGGGEGMLLTGLTPPAGLPLAGDQWLYLLCLAAAALAILAARNIIRSGSGLAMMAVRDNEIAAKVAGIDTTRVKRQGFAISAAFAAGAGTLYAFVVQFVGPDAFHLLLAVAFLTAIVVGGLGRISGAVYGAVFLVFAPSWTSQINEALSGITYGLLLIVVMIAMPSGIAGLISKGLNRVTGTARRRSKPLERTPSPVQPPQTVNNEGQ